MVSELIKDTKVSLMKFDLMRVIMARVKFKKGKQREYLDLVIKKLN